MPQRTLPDRDVLIDGEAPLRVDELFFSRTDLRGVILAGNDVFQRVSGYGWEDLLGAPHKLIRHPHMPKAVFRLMWQEIQAGRPIGAYVKNRARCGRHYWVYAIVTPIEGGYLSVRLKPTADLLAKVDGLYRDLRGRELDGGLDAEAGAAALIAGVRALGFENYPAFMAAAAAREMLARDRATGHEDDGQVSKFEQVLGDVARVATEARSIIDASQTITVIPHNMRVQAARLGDAAGAISVIAHNYTELSAEIWERVGRFADSLEEVQATASEGLFLVCAARLQREMAQVFALEHGLPGMAPRDEEICRLAEQCEIYAGRALAGVRDIAVKAREFEIASDEVRRGMAGLSATRVLCKVEIARLRAGVDGLAEIVEQLERFQSDAGLRLGRIISTNRRIGGYARTLLDVIARPSPAALGAAA